MIEDLILSNRYRLTERLATGGMGEVWRAQDELLARPVAVKLLRSEFVSDRAARSRFQAEARFAASLQHGGIAQVYDFGEQGEQVYLVMELVSGEPLSGILRRSGKLAPEATLDIIGQAARALHVAHQSGIVHRDIKPANLMITADGTVKITDFGIARTLTGHVSMTGTGMVMGTAAYVSPEQAAGRELTSATDLYSLGVVAYECLAGSPPFTADTSIEILFRHVREEPPRLDMQTPALVRQLVAELLAKDPSDRPASARSLADRALVLRQSLMLGGAPKGHTQPISFDLDDEHDDGSNNRSALFLTSVAVGILLLGVIVVGSLLRLPSQVGRLNGNSAAQSAPVTPAKPGRATTQPSGVATDPGPSGNRSATVNPVSTPPTRQTSTPSRASTTPTPTAPVRPSPSHPTPTPTTSTTTSTTPTSSPQPSPSITAPRGLGSDTKV